VQPLNEQLSGITESVAFVIPELILSVAILVLLLTGLISRNANLFRFITMAAIASSLFFILRSGFEVKLVLFNGMLQRDGFGQFLMLLVDTSVVLTCLISGKQEEKRHWPEYYALLLSIALGSHLLLMSTNFIMVFLSLELVSISSYVLAGYAFSKQGSEGSLKYFLFGSVASAIMLYGFSILYGITGTLDFTSSRFFDQLITSPSPLILIAGGMGLSGFLFKMSAVPMHPWAPDVYEAAPLPVIAYLSVAPKLAALGILTKFLLALHLFGQGEYDWQLMAAGIAILTLTFGNFSALWQTNPKRMMAYSSIAQSGFLLVGVAAFLPQSIHFMLFYATVYLLMNFAVFIYLSYFEKQGIYLMESFSGQGKHFIWASVGLTGALVALTGLPPTSGFTAKLFIFSGLWESYEATHKPLLLWLLIFGLLNTVISLFYYLRIPYFAFIKAGTVRQVEKKVLGENLLGFILVVLIVVIFFIPGLLMSLINRINFVL
jgi:NADH-quinone oxidoreductase subunit N